MKEFEEVNIPEDLKNVISNDYILRYKNGTYIFEEKLTDDFCKKIDDEYLAKEKELLTI